jgi:hypothetical protein
MSPSSGPASGGQATAFGGGFLNGIGLKLDDVEATSVSVIDGAMLCVTTPPLVPGTLYDVTVTNAGAGSGLSATLPKGYFVDFLMSPGEPLPHFIETVFGGITAGIGSGYYGGDDPVTRAQWRFATRRAHGSTHASSVHGIFQDVTCTPGVGFPDWIEELFLEGITAGCNMPGTPLAYWPRQADHARSGQFSYSRAARFESRAASCTGVRDVTCTRALAFGLDRGLMRLALQAAACSTRCAARTARTRAPRWRSLAERSCSTSRAAFGRRGAAYAVQAASPRPDRVAIAANDVVSSRARSRASPRRASRTLTPVPFLPAFSPIRD